MSGEALPTRRPQVTELDGLRAISVVFVMLVHATYGRLSGGFLGVDIFFVISGYLITMLLMQERERTGSVSLRNFYLRRIFRILPPLIACIFLAMAVWNGLPQDRFGVVTASLLFYANFMPPETMANLGHTWSLAIEEQFYVFWPALFIWIGIRWPKLLIAIALAVCAGALFVRFSMVARGGDLSPLYSFTPARIDAIMFGALLALTEPTLVKWIGNWSIALKKGLAVACLAALLAALFFLTRSFMQGFPPAFTVFSLIVALLILLAPRLDLSSSLRWFLNHPVMRWLGKRSYGLYLYHYPVFGALEALRVEGSLANYAMVTLAKILISLAITEASWRLIEQPALRFKERYSWSRAQ